MKVKLREGKIKTQSTQQLCVCVCVCVCNSPPPSVMTWIPSWSPILPSSHMNNDQGCWGSAAHRRGNTTLPAWGKMCRTKPVWKCGCTVLWMVYLVANFKSLIDSAMWARITVKRRTHTQAHTHTHTQIHTHKHTRKYTHMHTRKYTRTHRAEQFGQQWKQSFFRMQVVFFFAYKENKALTQDLTSTLSGFILFAITSFRVTPKMSRVGPNHTYICIYGVCTVLWQWNYHTHGHIRCTYTVLANPKDEQTTRSCIRPFQDLASMTKALTIGHVSQAPHNLTAYAQSFLRWSRYAYNNISTTYLTMYAESFALKPCTYSSISTTELDAYYTHR